jgi:hypothetical protein
MYFRSLVLGAVLAFTSFNSAFAEPIGEIKKAVANGLLTAYVSMNGLGIDGLSYGIESGEVNDEGEVTNLQVAAKKHVTDPTTKKKHYVGGVTVDLTMDDSIKATISLDWKAKDETVQNLRKAVTSIFNNLSMGNIPAVTAELPALTEALKLAYEEGEALIGKDVKQIATFATKKNPHNSL